MNAAAKREPEIVSIAGAEITTALRRRRDSRPAFRDIEPPLVCDVFTVEEIHAANMRHDLKYGWSKRWPTIYTNRLRLPETALPDDRP
jgi:hypothetical protein